MRHGKNGQQRVSSSESLLRPDLEKLLTSDGLSPDHKGEPVRSGTDRPLPLSADGSLSVVPAKTTFPAYAEANVPRLITPEPNHALAFNGLRRPVFESSDLGRLLPHHALSESGSGVSDFNFLSIEPIYDRGSKVHQLWEKAVMSHSSPQPQPPVPQPQQLLVKEARRFSTVSLESIGEEICKSFKTSAVDDRKYIPLDRLCEILSYDVVYELLRQYAGSFDVDLEVESRLVEILGTHPEQRDDETTSPLPPRRRRIFAILILIEKISILDKLIEAQFDDTSLPLTFEQDSDNDEWYMVSHDPEIRLPVPWSSRVMENFLFYQQTIHVPFFKFPGDVIYFYNLGHGSALPFSFYEPRGSGGYGSVQKVQIHQAHHSNGNAAEV